MTQAIAITKLSIVNPLQLLQLPQWRRTVPILASVGFFIGTLLDGAHSHTNTIQYTNPVFWLAAWWTPFVFAMGSLTTGFGRPVAELIFKQEQKKMTWPTVILSNALFYTAYILSGYLPMDHMGRTYVLLGIWLVLWLSCDRTWLGIGLSIITAIWGPLLEALLSSVGAFRYVTPDLYAVTSWLPVLYAIAAISSGHLGKILVQGPGKLSSSHKAIHP